MKFEDVLWLYFIFLFLSFSYHFFISIVFHQFHFHFPLFLHWFEAIVSLSLFVVFLVVQKWKGRGLIFDNDLKEGPKEKLISTLPISASFVSYSAFQQLSLSYASTSDFWAIQTLGIIFVLVLSYVFRLPPGRIAIILSSTLCFICFLAVLVSEEKEEKVLELKGFVFGLICCFFSSSTIVMTKRLLVDTKDLDKMAPQLYFYYLINNVILFLPLLMVSDVLHAIEEKHEVEPGVYIFVLLAAFFFFFLDLTSKIFLFRASPAIFAVLNIMKDSTKTVLFQSPVNLYSAFSLVLAQVAFFYFFYLFGPKSASASPSSPTLLSSSSFPPTSPSFSSTPPPTSHKLLSSSLTLPSSVTSPKRSKK